MGSANDILDRAAASEEKAATKQGGEPRKRSVLLVDDNPAIRESLTLLFRLAGFDVLQAEEGEAGLAVVARERPDVIVTDLRMPNVDGVELIRRVRALDSEARATPIIAMSVHGVSELEAADVAGADAWVDKLANFEDLLAAVRKQLDR